MKKRFQNQYLTLNFIPIVSVSFRERSADFPLVEEGDIYEFLASLHWWREDTINSIPDNLPTCPAETRYEVILRYIIDSLIYLGSLVSNGINSIGSFVNSIGSSAQMAIQSFTNTFNMFASPSSFLP